MTYRPAAPGLAVLAAEKGLSDEVVRKLDRAWNTIRGRRPQTLEEWLPLYDAVRKYFEEQDK